MEHLIRVAGDSLPLGLHATAPLARTLRRLEAESGALTGLRGADQPLATLTCGRLETLTTPTTHRQVLADALAGQPAGVAEEAQPSPGRDGRPRRPERPVLGRPGLRTQGVPGAAAGTFAEQGFARRNGGGGSGGDGSRPSAQDRGARAGLAEPTGSGPPGPADGLDWLASRVPGGDEALRTRVARRGSEDNHELRELLRARPEGKRWSSSESSVRPAPRPAPERPTHPQRGDEPTVGARRERADFRRHDPVPLEEDRRRGAVEFQPPLPPLPSQPAGARGLAAPPDPPAGQLEALVRSWSVRESEVADTTARHESRRPGFGPRLRIDSRQGSRLPNPVSDAYHAPRASADDDLAAFGDTLGRVLVAELQRYGIEVDEG